MDRRKTPDGLVEAAQLHQAVAQVKPKARVVLHIGDSLLIGLNRLLGLLLALVNQALVHPVEAVARIELRGT